MVHPTNSQSKQNIWRVFWVVYFFAITAIVAGICFAHLMTRQPLSVAKADDVSPVVYDDRGRILRAYLSIDEKWRLKTTLKDVPKHLINILLAYEDKRFFRHSGIDYFAVIRALAQSAQNYKVVSGASTITMQVARLLRQRRSGILSKLVQMSDSRTLERSFSKDDILSLYLTLAPFGRNVEGVRAASLIYFGKEPKQLDPPESALLVALAQSPRARRPDRYPDVARRARDRILRRAIALKVIDESWGSYLGRPIAVNRAKLDHIGHHFTDRLRLSFATNFEVATQIDSTLQRQIASLIRKIPARSTSHHNGDIMVLRNRDCGIKAYLGSADYFDARNAGQFDHVRAVRSPGSTLKPLIYGLGFEELVITPQSIVVDRPIAFDSYAPRNFNAGYQGEMTMRDALIRSINTTAVAVLAKISPRALVDRLRANHIRISMAGQDHFAGLAIGLGGASVSLEDLTRLYSGFARQGIVCPKELSGGRFTGDRTRILSKDAAWAVADVLADAPPPSGFARRRSKNGARRIAFKTGTSYGYRDAWAVGFDRRHTVGVWIGRSDGTATLGATGATSAAPLLYRIFDLLPTPNKDVAGPAPSDTVLSRSSNIPERLRRFNMTPVLQKPKELKIMFPHVSSTFEMYDAKKGIPLVADGGYPPYYWLVDGHPVDIRVENRWTPQGVGRFKALVLDRRGSVAEVNFEVK